MAPDPPQPQDGAARQPWLGLQGHAPAQAYTIESRLQHRVDLLKGRWGEKHETTSGGLLSRNIPAQCGGQPGEVHCVHSSACAHARGRVH